MRQNNRFNLINQVDHDDSCVSASIALSCVSCLMRHTSNILTEICSICLKGEQMFIEHKYLERRINIYLRKG